jgi:DNA N-6-adenine-methyltransferase (Dam)
MVNRLRSLNGEIEWYTPRQYLASVRRVLGKIELDPASSEVAQRLVRARTYYDLAANGLLQNWQGKVFLNPPYAMPTIRDFVRKLTDEFRNGNVPEAILLTNAATDTAWYDLALSCASAKCDTRGRISFLGNAQGKFFPLKTPACGQTFFYFGDRKSRFVKEFSRYGRILIELPAPNSGPTPGVILTLHSRGNVFESR